MIPFLLGERIYLRALVDEDANENYPLWFNDEEVCAGNSHHVYPYSRDEARQYIRNVNADRSQLVLAICLQDIGNKHIGNVALQNIHPVYRSAEFAIVIGDKECWNKGYGKEAAALMIDHGFGTLNLHRVTCGTFETNIGMMVIALWLGMKQEGVRRDAAFKDGKYLPVIEFGMVRNEWQSVIS